MGLVGILLQAHTGAILWEVLIQALFLPPGSLKPPARLLGRTTEIIRAAPLFLASGVYPCPCRGCSPQPLGAAAHLPLLEPTGSHHSPLPSQGGQEPKRVFIFTLPFVCPEQARQPILPGVPSWGGSLPSCPSAGGPSLVGGSGCLRPSPLVRQELRRYGACRPGVPLGNADVRAASLSKIPILFVRNLMVRHLC